MFYYWDFRGALSQLHVESRRNRLLRPNSLGLVGTRGQEYFLRGRNNNPELTRYLTPVCTARQLCPHAWSVPAVTQESRHISFGLPLAFWMFLSTRPRGINHLYFSNNFFPNCKKELQIQSKGTVVKSRTQRLQALRHPGGLRACIHAHATREWPEQRSPCAWTLSSPPTL